VTALDGVSFTLEPGQVHGVVGPNGSGKTTMFNAVSGFVQATSGTVTVDGSDVTGEVAERRIQRGLVRTFQTPRFDQDLTVEQTIRSGQRMSVRGGLLASMVPTPRVLRDERSIVDRTAEILTRFELEAVRDVRLGKLPMGVVRLVEVARAAAMEPRYLLLDEPAAGLSREEQAVLVAQLRTLAAAHDMGILIVEHNFGLLHGLVSELMVLQQGKAIARGTPGEIADDVAVRAAYLGISGDAPTTGEARFSGQPDAGTTRALEVREFDVSYGQIGVVEAVSLEVGQGELVAVVGANGAGKSSLLNALAGLSDSGRRSRGEVLVDGVPVNRLDAAMRARAGLAHVPEGRGNIFPALTTRENLTLAGRVAAPEERTGALDRAVEVFPALGGLLTRVAGSMSGGEQQMLAIAMALAQHPRVILMDEPTQGLAPAVRLTIADAFSRLRETGGPSVLLAEQNYAFAARLADRMLVMAAGRLRALPPETALAGADAIASIYLGADVGHPPPDRW
jgi:ABC-type branched-subunit amino acid transport system ATPase component